MREFIDLSTTVPLDEECVQLGTNEYIMGSRLEVKAFVEQIKREHGEPPIGASISIIKCPHDFGTYHDVRIIYDTDKPASEEWALKVEEELPYKWDEEAIEYLSRNLYDFPNK
jgi:hypothetical protein